MTQKIKVRVWSGTMWLDGNDANIHAKYPDKRPIELISSYPHREHEICLSTGLFDKNRKEIFSGDVLDFIDGSGEVEMRNGSWCVCYNDPFDNHFENPDKLFAILVEYKETAKVIGNVFENPELLK